MSFKEAVVSCFTKYATFSGRARRSEYWYFVLFNALVNALLVTFLDKSIIISLYELAVFIPHLAVSWRRMHDTGRCGAWSLITLVPLVGWIFFLIFVCTDSESGTNQYGPNPKEKRSAEA